MNFWETVRGVMLAETLIEYLPNIAKEKKQEVCMFDTSASLKKGIDDKLKDNHLVHSITKTDLGFLVIFERNKGF